MFDALLSGKMYGEPSIKIGKNGNQFVTAKMLVSCKDGESVFANLIAFNEDACRHLSGLRNGDALAVSCEVTPKSYTNKAGEPATSLDALVHSVGNLYQIKKKRAAQQPKSAPVPHYAGIQDIPDDPI